MPICSGILYASAWLQKQNATPGVVSIVDEDRGDAFGFVEYAVQGFVDGLAHLCRYVEEVQMALAWEHFVFHRLRQERQTPAARRRREVKRRQVSGP